MELAEAGSEAGAPAVDLELAEGSKTTTNKGNANLPKKAALPGVKPDETKTAEASKPDEQNAAETALAAAKGEAKPEAAAKAAE
jgi:hypothetical protein